ncbi:MAG TPA: hypothetical protein VFX76_02885 [Roseiflexaceae bacterium]|nr:hypothetical protein [Roseiflexaceae bacterium]
MTEKQMTPEEPVLQAKATALGGYLIIARYNRDKWNHLATIDQTEAHERAEIVFPEDDARDLPQNLTRATMRQYEADPLRGVQMLRSFHTSAFASLIERLAENEKPPEDRPKKTPTQVVDTLFAMRKAPAGTNEKDPGIGWVAVVEATFLASFVEQLGGKDGPLWRMYDIDVIPLNDDKTTKDIYAFMTPVNWKK